MIALDPYSSSYLNDVYMPPTPRRYRPTTMEGVRREFKEWLQDIFPNDDFYQVRLYEVVRKVWYAIRQPKPKSNLKARLYK